jgi:hypothetical protein
MGVQNIKFETEVFQVPQFQIPNNTPVETKPDLSILTQLASQLGQLTLAVSQVHQVVTGQAFTRAVGQSMLGAEGLNATDEIRKLNQRLDDIEARLPRGKETSKAA